MPGCVLDRGPWRDGWDIGREDAVEVGAKRTLPDLTVKERDKAGESFWGRGSAGFCF